MVSIILPVYNVAPYLATCLDSILSQSFKNWEAICVDDGSTDGSGAILDAYAGKDARLHVIHQSNQGLPGARNEGLRHSHGIYVMMVDSDDWIEPDMVERMVGMMEDTKAELGMCGWWIDHEDSEEKTVRCPGQCFSSLGIEYDKLELNPRLRRHFPNCVWNKIFRRRRIERLGLSFTAGATPAEDLEFVVKYISHCPDIAYLYRPLYHYREGIGITNGIMEGKMTEQEFQVCMEAWSRLMKCKAGRHLSRMQKKGFYTILLQSVLSWRELYRWVPSCSRDSKRPAFPYGWIFLILFKGSCLPGLRIVMKTRFPGFTGWLKKWV